MAPFSLPRDVDFHRIFHLSSDSSEGNVIFFFPSICKKTGKPAGYYIGNVLFHIDRTGNFPDTYFISLKATVIT